MRPLSKLLVGTALLLVVPFSVAAQGLPGQEHESRYLSDKFQIGMGAFFADFTTDAMVGFGATIGTRIRLEDDLGIKDNKSSFLLEGQWRFKPKHALSWNVYSFSREGTSVLDEQIEIEDKIFVVDATLDTKFDSDSFGLNYRYSFINNGKTEAGISAGLSTFKYGIDVKGEAYIGDPNVPDPPTDVAAASESLLAPVPNFGMYINHAFSTNWILRLGAGFLNLEIEDYDGRYAWTRATVDWYFIRNFGVGAGLASSNLKFTKSGDDPWSVDYRYSGFLFYVTGVF
jgi:hypothetical protein